MSRAAWPIRVARLTGLLAMLVAAIGLAMWLPMLAPARRAQLLGGWFRALLRAIGVTLSVHDRRQPLVGVGGADALTGPQPRGALLVANHVSWLDIPAILAVRPARVLAKSEVRDWPVIGLLAARVGTIFIDRRRLRRLPHTVAEIATQLRAGHDVLVFPEGSTRCGRTMGRFYPATLQAAADAHAEVRPVALRYLVGPTPTTAAAFVGADSLCASLWRVLSTQDITVEVHIGPSLLPTTVRSGNSVGPLSQPNLLARPAYTRRALADAAASTIARVRRPRVRPRPRSVARTPRNSR